MNAQQLEYARTELTKALVDISGGTKGQLEAFSENPPADKDHYPRLKIHKIQLEGGREVCMLTTPTYALETRSRKRPMPPMNEFEFSLCSWRRAVNTLNEFQNAWLNYCYGFNLKFEYQVLFCKHIWEIYQKHLSDNPVQTKVKKRLISLVWLAAQDVAAKNNNETYKEYAGSALATLMSISRSTWCEVYAPHWARLKQAFEELDEEALQLVLNRCPDPIIDEVSD
ncbi:bacteriophage antitermination protein Q [Yersinia enterocolitica]|uniref:bacteriophage antitermination protein Q n=1 Tax=Yersinia enterocolitica TaxID=630 RepID=UPI00398CF95B